VVRGVVNHFVNDGSTVTLGCLDLAKAFDKCNHYGLFLKLMNANIPVNFIHLFCDWFRKASIQVRWGGALSSSVLLDSNKRQGSVLSLTLFSFYNIDILWRHIDGTPHSIAYHHNDYVD